MSKIIYTGFFIDDSKLDLTLEADRIRLGQGFSELENTIRFPHVTTAFKPEEVNEAIFGKEVQIELTGYANDGRNEGFLVRLSSDDPEVQKEIDKIKKPHITLSVADGARPVDTAKLEFQPIEPGVVRGVFGAFEAPGKVRIQKQSERLNIDEALKTAQNRAEEGKDTGLERPSLRNEQRASIR